MTLYFASNVRAGSSHPAPEGWADNEWHRAAIADTGTSHTRVGRVYVVRCEWCEDAFAALTARDAMTMFRTHEEAMLTLHPTPEQTQENER